VTHDALKLTTYLGERDRAGGVFAADALAALYARHGLRTSIVLRGALGFGAAHHLRTDRLLTLSEDLPVVSIAVDAAERVAPVVAEAEALLHKGLVTTERAQLLDGAEFPREAKLTLFLRRGDDHRSAVAALRRHGVAGATVLLGVDGTAGGQRRRATFFGGNPGVPVMVLSVGEGPALAAAAAALAPAFATVERVRVLRRDGVALGAPEHDGPAGSRQKLTIYSRAPGLVVTALRAAGAAGATALRGIWGYHGEHEPHGDVLWQVRRRAPLVTVAVDAPENVARWWPAVERATARTGLVTTETLPVGPNVPIYRS
jgi:PII-like signaling protein